MLVFHLLIVVVINVFDAILHRLHLYHRCLYFGVVIFFLSRSFAKNHIARINFLVEQKCCSTNELFFFRRTSMTHMVKNKDQHIAKNLRSYGPHIHTTQKQSMSCPFLECYFFLLIRPQIQKIYLYV